MPQDVAPNVMPGLFHPKTVLEPSSPFSLRKSYVTTTSGSFWMSTETNTQNPKYLLSQGTCFCLQMLYEASAAKRSWKGIREARKPGFHLQCFCFRTSFTLCNSAKCQSVWNCGDVGKNSAEKLLSSSLIKPQTRHRHGALCCSEVSLWKNSHLWVRKEFSILWLILFL